MKGDDFLDDEITQADASKADGELILASLAKNKYQTLLLLKRNTNLPIHVVTDWIETFRVQYKIGSQAIGWTEAYFLPENAPKGKLFFSGDGRISIRREKARGNTGTRKIGETVVLTPQRHFPEKKNPFTTPLTAIDTEELRRLASKGLDKRAIAEKLNIKYSRLCSEITNFDKLARALSEGEKDFMQKQTKKEPETESAPPAKRSKKYIEISAEDLEAAAAENPSLKIVAGKLGCGESTLEQKIRGNQSLSDALRRGRDAFKTKNPNQPPASKSGVDTKAIEEAAYEGLSCARAAEKIGIKPSSFSFLFSINNAARNTARRGSEEKTRRAEEMLAEGKTIEPPPTANSSIETGARIIDEAKEVQEKIIEPEEKPKHKGFVNCSGCDKPYNHFPSHIPADASAICRDCEKNNQLPPEEVIAEENTGLMVDPRRETVPGDESLTFIASNAPPEIEIYGLRRMNDSGLSVSFDGDFFELPKEKRIILLQMADMKEKFEER